MHCRMIFPLYKRYMHITCAIWIQRYSPLEKAPYYATQRYYKLIMELYLAAFLNLNIACKLLK